jgi:YD repeat-containing protein
VDAATGDTTAVTDARNYTTSFDVDSVNGDLKSVTNALSQTTQYTYDVWGQLLTLKDPQNHQTVYTRDDASRVTAIQDANLKATQYGWDLMDRVTSTTQTLSGTPLTTTFQYDGNGNRIVLTDAKGHVWQWLYDGEDRVSQETNPLNQSASTVWDGNGNPQSRTDAAGQKSEYTYGPNDRLEGETYRKAPVPPAQVGATDSTVDSYYDSGTHLLDTVLDTGFCCTYLFYDDMDCLVEERNENGSSAVTLDDLGRRTQLDVYALLAWHVEYQAPVTYGYDQTDNVTSITQNAQAATVDYDPLGRMTKRTLPNGVSTEWAFDTAGFLSSVISKKNGVAFDSHTFQRDAVGNITQETANGVVTNYVYDDLYRLVTQKNGAGVTIASWTYDAVGNRLSQTVSGQTTTWTYDNANRVATVADASGTATPTHDTNGNLTAFKNDTYGWDVRGRLRTLTRKDAQGNTILSAIDAYDPWNRRMVKGVNGVTSRNSGRVFRDILAAL